ncbi:MAG: glutamate--tRNA ligase family protein [Candidatus Nanoarchaeia archaeon]|nr:glutamate--tRNA ligase family protein [Candidatus Nanoarchaeia archaeon]
MKNWDKLIRAYGLKNALSHEGAALQGPVISSLFHEGLEKKDVGKYAKRINEILSEINSLSPEEQEKEFRKLEKEVSERPAREGLPELPDAEKGVVMRFRPSPSGFIHVGNIIGAGLPNSLYAKKYRGKFYVIVDDTNPESVLPEAYKQIKQDCDWIFGNVYKYINSSDRMEIYYNYAEKLIKKDAVYVCVCPPERFRKFAEAKKNCPCRKNSAKENLELWNRMLDKGKDGFKEEDAVLRFKSDMKDENPAMRDFPLARINLHKHPLHGNKYKVWPLMNFAVAVDDIELKMTHIIRGKDHMDNAKRQKMIFDVFKKKFPWTFFIGRIKFNDLILSKRKMTEMINKGEFSGYEDERLPTVVSLRKRGYKPEAFAKFVEQRGLTEVDKVMDSKEFFQIIDQFNE